MLHKGTWVKERCNPNKWYRVVGIDDSALPVVYCVEDQFNNPRSFAEMELMDAADVELSEIEQSTVLPTTVVLFAIIGLFAVSYAVGIVIAMIAKNM